MKKIFMILFMILMFVSISSCGKKADKSKEQNMIEEQSGQETEKREEKTTKSVHENIDLKEGTKFVFDNWVCHYSDSERFTVEGKEVRGVEIEDTGVYYITDKKIPDVYIFGTSAMDYSDFYYGILNSNPIRDLPISEKNPADELKVDGLYDRVNPAAVEKGSQLKYYPEILNYTPGPTDKEGAVIEGIKGIDIQVKATDYIEGMILYNSGHQEYPLANQVQRITVSDSPEFNNNIRTLLRDGSYAGPVTVTKGKSPLPLDRITIDPSIDYHLSCADYEFRAAFKKFDKKDENSDYYYKKFFTNLYGVTVRNESGTVCGTVFYEDIEYRNKTCNPVNIYLSNGEVEKESKKFNIQRFTPFFEGKKLKPGTYTLTFMAKGYEDVSVDIEVKQKLDKLPSCDYSKIWDESGIRYEIDFKVLPEDYNPKQIRLKNNKLELTENDFIFNFDAGELIIKPTPNTGIGKYTLKMQSDKYQPIVVYFKLSSTLTEEQISITDGKLVIAEGTDTDLQEYLVNLRFAHFYRKGEEKYFDFIYVPKHPLFEEDGTLNTEVEHRGERIFTEPGDYIISLESDGYFTFRLPYRYE